MRKGEYILAKDHLEKLFEIKRGEKDFWAHYLLQSNEYRLGNLEQPFIYNFQLSRESLCAGNLPFYTSFLKTNSWICNDFHELELSSLLAKSNLLQKGERSNKYKALLDLINIEWHKCDFETVLVFVEILEGCFDDEDFGIEEKVSINLKKLNVYLFYKKNNFMEYVEELKKRYDFLELGTEPFDELQSLIAGYYIQLKRYDEAEKYISLIIDHKVRLYYKAVLFSRYDYKKSKKIFKKILKLKNKSYSNEIADIDLYLAKVFANSKNYNKASALLSKAKSLLDPYMNPIQKEIESEIITILNENGLDKESTYPLCPPQEKNFFLKDLPKKINSIDGKEMRYIKQGFSIFSVDNFSIPTTQEIFDEVSLYLENDDDHCQIRFLCDYYIDTEVVKVRDYKKYLHDSNQTSSLFFIMEEKENDPITNLTFEEMQDYATFYGKLIPLPEEWEKACRGPNNLNYPWGDKWDKSIKIDIGEDDFNHLAGLFVDYENFEDYLNWFKNYTENENENLGILTSIQPSQIVKIDKYYFFKLLFNSLSLDTLEKFRIIDTIPTLSQFQFDELTKVFSEEVIKFKDLSVEHPDDIVKLFKRMKNQALEIIGELALKKSSYVCSTSPYKVKNMIGNGYEMTANDNQLVLKGSIITFDYKERFKAKNSWSIDISEGRESRVKQENKYSRTSFRCVKPIYTMKDLEELIDD